MRQEPFRESEVVQAGDAGHGVADGVAVQAAVAEDFPPLHVREAVLGSSPCVREAVNGPWRRDGLQGPWAFDYARAEPSGQITRTGTPAARALSTASPVPPLPSAG